MPAGAADIGAATYIEADRMLRKSFPFLPGIGARFARFEVGKRFGFKEFSSHDGIWPPCLTPLS